MITLSKEQVMRLHKYVIEATGGTYGIRDEAMLDSALSTAFQTFDNIELYPSTTAKIARISYGIIRNHPFVDGNKRVGTLVMLLLLDLNHIQADFTDEIIIKIGLEIADGKMSDNELACLILQRTV